VTAHRIHISEDDYHADQLGQEYGPSLSNSIAKVLLDKSPAHAYAQHPRLGGVRKDSTKTFDAGKLAHKLILGKGAELLVVDAKDWKKKAAQTARKEARASGKIPALVGDYKTATKAAQVVREKLARLGIDLVGESELQVTWEERRPHGGVRCRGMLDHVELPGGRAVIYDLKTTRDSKPSAISNSVIRYGYDTQRAAYTRALEQLYPGLGPADVDFMFIFAETVEPFAVTVGRLDDVLRERGEERWVRAVDIWDECLRFDAWPEYASSIVEIAAPPWMHADIEIGYEEEE
jgi:hypothetical protein